MEVAACEGTLQAACGPSVGVGVGVGGEPQARGSAGNTQEGRPELVGEILGDLPRRSALCGGQSSPGATGPRRCDQFSIHGIWERLERAGWACLGDRVEGVDKGWQSPPWLSLKRRLLLGHVPTFWFGITSLAHLMAISHLSSFKHLGRGTDQGRESSPCPRPLHYSVYAHVSPSPWRHPRFICQSSIFWHPLYAWVVGACVKDIMESKTRGLIFRDLSLMGRNSSKLISSPTVPG